MKTVFLILLINLSLLAQSGISRTYHLNGNPRTVISYSDGIYDGTSYWYYENGNLKEEKTYSNGKLNGWVRTYYESGLLKEEYFVDNGVLDGSKKEYYDNGALEYIRYYEKGKLLSTKYFKFDPRYEPPIEAYYAGSKQTGKKSDNEIMCDVQICAAPVGGMKAVYDKITYPEHAELYGLEGKVIISATVNEKGQVTDANVVKGIGLGCDEEALNAVKNTKFLPGQDENGVVVSNLTITINFELDSSSKAEMSSAALQSGPNTETKEIDPAVAQQSLQNRDYNTETIEEKEIQDDKVSNSEYTKPSEKDIDLETERKSFECDLTFDVCAKPLRGIAAILDNFIIPRKVKENNIKGEVIVEAGIDEKGNVKSTNVIKGLPHGCSVAVEVAILDTKFEPATKNGKPVASKVKITVPVDY